MVDDGIRPQAAANQFDINVENVMSIMQTRKQVGSLEKSHTKRNNLGLGDKLIVLNLMNLHKNQAQLARICKIHRKTLKMWLIVEIVFTPLKSLAHLFV